MSTPEGRVKARLKRILDAYRPQLYNHWPVQNGMGEPTLDCNGAINGRAFSIECKAPGGGLTARQIQTIEKMTKAGVRVFVYNGCVEDETEIQEFLLYWKARGLVENGV